MLHALVKDRVVLMVPSTPGPAPLISTQWAELRAWNATCLRINSIAGIAGLPQVGWCCCSNQLKALDFCVKFFSVVKTITIVTILFGEGGGIGVDMLFKKLQVKG